MYKYIALTALVLGSAALGFSMNRGGDEQFTLAVVEDLGEDWQAFPWQQETVIIDLDQDGHDDMIQAYDNTEYPDTFDLRVRMNQGDVPFSTWESIGTYEINIGQPSDAEINIDAAYSMNINGDSYPDLIFAISVDDWGGEGDYHAKCMAYMINNGSGGFTCAGDVTGDGTTDVNDLLGVIGDWGCIEEGLPD